MPTIRWPAVSSRRPTASAGSLASRAPRRSTGAHTLLGYLLLSSDVVRIPAYSGRPINTLIGLDVHGQIVGVRIAAHEEPILAAGISEDSLRRYVDQYECHYCLDCQVTYWSEQRCPPLVEKRKRREKSVRAREMVRGMETVLGRAGIEDIPVRVEPGRSDPPQKP